MKATYTHITVVLDRSGSMGACATDTIGGFNTFLQKQREAPGEATMSLILFDHEYDIRYHVRPVVDVPMLDASTYLPRGNTALLDAMGRAISYTGELLKLKRESDRPAKVVFVVITDGEENSSREYSRDQVFGMVEHQTNAYKWEFVYLGANQDAIRVAARYAFRSANTAAYASGAVGQTMSVVADKVANLRASVMFVGEDAGFEPFTSAERASMVDEDSKKKAQADKTLNAPRT